jgi:hypothetical protein
MAVGEFSSAAFFCIMKTPSSTGGSKKPMAMDRKMEPPVL